MIDKHDKVLLKDTAYDKIKEKMIRGDEEYTSENTLVQELSMSRTPIREALNRLQYEGFLKILPNRGIVFTELSVEERNELIDMRIAIETYSLKQAESRIRDHHIQELARIIGMQEKAYRAGDFADLVEKDALFHHYLLEIVGNSQFIKMYRHARERQFTVRAGKWLKNQPDILQTFIEEHRTILDAITRKDIPAAIQHLVEHLEKGKL
ncbi:DNA-binding GntR family transcriptional regulator [Paenibacillus forsythiae]|uniref:DNA-binding GntR family transcriptional regulator n=1 Tax=Paenibacillus forsythiae TaxID=365616 RepID=A0ABU3HAA8_9BACL|nr:GntR family transcriptional regulator [Paenibacillus forsythiae]MDT3427754.1 DNA-binding GntR family transcriptional regulator [Paenibacillus forsythiae]